MRKIKNYISRKFYSFVGRFNPKWVANRKYHTKFGRNINWDHPTEFNEIIRWMQFYTDTSKWSLLADKYKVREHVENRGYGNILVKLYGVWEKAEDINFDLLPNSFVLKTNHGYGEVIIVNDKTQVNVATVRKKIKKYLNTPFGYASAEIHYLKIKPVIIAEQLINNDCSWSSSIVDYKFYCFNGEPFCCAVFFNRRARKHSGEIYDMKWQRRDEWIRKKCKPEELIDIPKPSCFDQMIKACHDLAGEFPFVRMDFYESGGKLYFGEFTFTPAGLTGGSLSKELLNQFTERLIASKNFTV